ncbi:SDR family NAD(P)-dependent oxidoreductase [Paenibacillus sp. A51L]
MVITDLQEEKIQEVVKEIEALGGDALGLKHNVASEEDRVSVVVSAIAKFGQKNVLVNNAGISDAVPFMDQSVECWERMMTVNVTSIFLGQKYVIPHMIEAGGGSIETPMTVDLMKDEQMVQWFLMQTPLPASASRKTSRKAFCSLL